MILRECPDSPVTAECAACILWMKRGWNMDEHRRLMINRAFGWNHINSCRLLISCLGRLKLVRRIFHHWWVDVLHYVSNSRLKNNEVRMVMNNLEIMHIRWSLQPCYLGKYWWDIYFHLSLGLYALVGIYSSFKVIMSKFLMKFSYFL